jgi:hypothetical protein
MAVGTAAKCLVVCQLKRVTYPVQGYNRDKLTYVEINQSISLSPPTRAVNREVRLQLLGQPPQFGVLEPLPEPILVEALLQKHRPHHTPVFDAAALDLHRFDALRAASRWPLMVPEKVSPHTKI